MDLSHDAPERDEYVFRIGKLLEPAPNELALSELEEQVKKISDEKGDLLTFTDHTVELRVRHAVLLMVAYGIAEFGPSGTLRRRGEPPPPSGRT